ncbi:MAG TPA: thioesterase family protein [Anaerolineales bacterium]|nr:thioesterase family protein [Anaerolineales bacterium]HRQ91867.1 thioesterase family protein [Anaerolineales bacterium]
MDFSKIPLTFEGTVQQDHLDFLGHMNVMWYTHFFDRATWNWYNSFGFGHEYHTQSGNGSFALESHTRYLAELRVGEEFKVYSRALQRNPKLFLMMHFMVRSRDGQLAAITELLGIHIDMATRRSSPLPKEIAALWDAQIAIGNKAGWDAPVSGVIKLG